MTKINNADSNCVKFCHILSQKGVSTLGIHGFKIHFSQGIGDLIPSIGGREFRPLKPVGTMIIHSTSNDARPYLGIDDFLLSVDEKMKF